MASQTSAESTYPDPGLCRDCRHSRRIESDRGSVFFRCELSLVDPRYPKYPRLPLIKCEGYQPEENIPGTAS